jgi:hypothetical protein
VTDLNRWVYVLMTSILCGATKDLKNNYVVLEYPTQVIHTSLKINNTNMYVFYSHFTVFTQVIHTSLKINNTNMYVFYSHFTVFTQVIHTSLKINNTNIYLPLQFMSGFGKTTIFNGLIGNRPNVFCWASDYLIWCSFWSPE